MEGTHETLTSRWPGSPDLLCFDLYSASRAMTALYRPLLDDLGLTYPQYLTLAVLARDGSGTIAHLAAALRLDHGTLTPLLHRLEAAGLVSRAERAADRRAVEVSLTASGQRVAARFDDIQCAVTEATGLTAAQVHRLQGTLRTLVRRLDSRPESAA